MSEQSCHLKGRLVKGSRVAAGIFRVRKRPGWRWTARPTSAGRPKPAQYMARVVGYDRNWTDNGEIEVEAICRPRC
jgi:hypothetical protein